MAEKAERSRLFREATEECRARLRTILETLPVGVFIFDASGRILEANAMAVRIWGGSAPLAEKIEEYGAYRAWRTDTGEPLGPGDWPAVRALREGKTSLGEKLHIERFDGRRAVILVSAAPLRNRAGEVDGAVAVIQDITGQMRAEEALRENVRLFRVIFDEAFQFMGLLTPDGILLQMNRTAADFIGMQPEEVIGRPFWETPWWAHSPAEQARLREGIERAARGEFVRFKTTHRRPDGEVIHVDFSLKPVRDEEGRVVLLVPEGRDVTAARKAEEALRKSRSKFYRLFHFSPVPMSISRLADGLFLEVNEAFCRFSGYAAEELLGKSSTRDINFWADEGDRTRFIKALRRQEEVFDFEAPLRIRDGSLRIGWLSARFFEFQGEECLLTSFRDVTDEKRLQDELRRARDAAEEASRAKGEFLSTVSHELRTPLTVIMGMVELAISRGPAPDVREFLEMALHAADSLLILINDILEISHIEERDLALERTPFLLRQCITDALAPLFAAARRKGIRLTLNFSGELPGKVLGDCGRVRQVLVNLVGNALKFTEKGEVSVRVEPAGKAGARGKSPVLFAVRDTGIGVATDKQDRLFRVFSQVDSSMTRRYGGTGLGLALSRGIVERMGGAIWMESEEGKGSTFSFIVPFERPQEGDG